MPTCLITGANRGIGLEFARQYAAEGWKVIATCRRPAEAEALNALEGEIEVQPLDVTDFARIEELAKKLGIGLDSIKSSPLKASPNPFEKIDPKARIILEGVVEDIYQSFRAMVKERRNFDEAQLEELADGRIFTGKQAVALGLIDVIGSEEVVLDWLYKERQISDSLEVKDYSLEDSYGKIANIFSMVYSVLSGMHASVQSFVFAAA